MLTDQTKSQTDTTENNSPLLCYTDINDISDISDIGDINGL